VKSAFQNVDNNLTNKANMDKVYNKTYQSYQLADANYKINLVQYNVGNAAMTNVLQAKISLDGANLNLIQAKAQQLTAVSQVFDALAVGYAAESELSKPKKIK
jgi:outer membrane protein TolC